MHTQEDVIMHTPEELRSILKVKKSTYVGLIRAGVLMCSEPSQARGSSSKYSDEDVIKNILIMELISCGLPQKTAHDLIEYSTIGRGTFNVSVGKATTISIDIESLLPKKFMAML